MSKLFFSKYILKPITIKQGDKDKNTKYILRLFRCMLNFCLANLFKIYANL